MKPWSTWILLLACLLVSGGCTYAVHVNHTGDFDLTQPMDDYAVVEATSAQDTFLGMVGQTDYVDEAYAKLQAQCPDGHITGIQTRYSTSHGFFSWTNTIVMRGYCSR